MGLETVELAIRFEDAFGIAIPDEVAVELTTPGKVTDYILTQVNAGSERHCLSQQAFYFLRKDFVSVLGISRSEFRPENELENLIPLESRKEAWLKMQHELGSSSLPTLARPIWLFYSLVFLTVLSFFVANVYLSQHDAGGVLAFFFALWVATGVGYTGAVATRPMQLNFRRGYKRAGDLARFLLLSNPRRFKYEWTREEVAETVRGIIIDEIGVEDFNEDSHFIKDMKLG